MYTALNLSKYITKKCIDDNEPITNLQLQKILYYIQREFLQKRGVSAFDDNIEAWKFGPVIPDIYYYYCGYGSMPISIETESFDLSEEEDDKRVIDGIVENKRRMPPWDLVAESHKKGGAWEQVYKKSSTYPKIIPSDLIREVG